MRKRHFLWVSLGLALSAGLHFGAAAQSAAEGPAAMIKRVSTEVLDAVKADQAIQSGDKKRIEALIDTKILPHVDFSTITKSVTGEAAWDQATPEQRSKLQDAFKDDLIRQYAFAFSQVRDETIEVGRVTKNPDDADQVVVRTNIVGRRKVPLNYYLKRSGDEWKIVDLDVENIRLVFQYKSQWGPVVKSSGIDGLIAKLTERSKAPAPKS